MWDHHYHTVPDCIIVEGPMAGGHLGFQESVLENIENIDFDAILCGVIDSKKPYEEKYTKRFRLRRQAVFLTDRILTMCFH